MYREVEGDLFDPAWDFDAIGHGVNLDGVMGSGIAPFFRKKSEAMYQVYRDTCLKGEMLPGDVMAWEFAENARPRWVYNMATQVKQGPNASYVLIALAAHNVWTHAIENDVRKIGLPRIGCGIGGLEWERVTYILESTFGPSENIEVVAVTKK
jgi:O-acetyl-ADP-ribose deacetylase (regulator of RNase III)